MASGANTVENLCHKCDVMAARLRLPVQLPRLAALMRFPCQRSRSDAGVSLVLDAAQSLGRHPSNEVRMVRNWARRTTRTPKGGAAGAGERVCSSGQALTYAGRWRVSNGS